MQAEGYTLPPSYPTPCTPLQPWPVPWTPPKHDHSLGHCTARQAQACLVRRRMLDGSGLGSIGAPPSGEELATALAEMGARHSAAASARNAGAPYRYDPGKDAGSTPFWLSMPVLRWMGSRSTVSAEPEAAATSSTTASATTAATTTTQSAPASTAAATAAAPVSSVQARAGVTDTAAAAAGSSGPETGAAARSVGVVQAGSSQPSTSSRAQAGAASSSGGGLRAEGGGDAGSAAGAAGAPGALPQGRMDSILDPLAVEPSCEPDYWGPDAPRGGRKARPNGGVADAGRAPAQAPPASEQPTTTGQTAVAPSDPSLGNGSMASSSGSAPTGGSSTPTPTSSSGSTSSINRIRYPSTMWGFSFDRVEPCQVPGTDAVSGRRVRVQRGRKGPQPYVSQDTPNLAMADLRIALQAS